MSALWAVLLGCGAPAPEAAIPVPVERPAPPSPDVPSAAERLGALQHGLVTLPPPGDPARVTPSLQARLDAFATVDLPRLTDPALDAWPRDLVLSAAGLALLEPLSLVQDGLPAGADALAHVPEAVRTSPEGRELLGHLASRLDPAHLAVVGRPPDLPPDAAEALAELPGILGDDLPALCGWDSGVPLPVVRIRVLTALLEADAEIAEAPGTLDLPADARVPWRWAPATSASCRP